MTAGKNPYGSPMSGGPMAGAPMRGGPVGSKPKNYLVESILLLVCCAGLFAIPAIIYAAQVDSKFNNGDYHGAVEASENAKKWCIIGLCIGLFCGLGGVALQVALIMAEAAA